MNKYHFFVIITAFLASVSQILLNISTNKPHKSKLFEYLNPYVITSYGILFVTLVVNNYLLRFVELNELTAIASVTYVFVLILSKIILKEKITLKKILGNLLIVAGIVVFML